MASELLSALGYDVCVVIGEIAFRGHQAIIVSLEGRRYLLDLGNGAPLFEPIPLDQPYETECAGLRYRFSRDEDAGQHLQERWISGAWEPFARYDLTPAFPGERASSYQRHHSLPPTGFVMGSFTLVRCLPDEVLQLRDHTFTHHTASGKTSREVHGLADFEALIHETFGLPLFPVEQSLEAWVAVTGATI
jgi:arylamine N-acetyltransferase